MTGFDALYNSCLFHSRERPASHSLVVGEFCDHLLRWQGRNVDTRMYKLQSRHLDLYSLRYGDEVQILPKVYKGFSLIQFSVNGSIDITIDGRQQVIHQGRAMITSPQNNIRQQWQKASEQIILRVPHTSLLATAKKMGTPERFYALLNNPSLLLSFNASSQWQAQLQCFATLSYFDQPNEQFQPWLDQFEQTLLTFLLLQTPCPPNTTLSDGQVIAQQTPTHYSSVRLERLREFVKQQMTAPVSLADMAGAAAISPRQLNNLCHKHFDMSPMDWLRTLRLDAIRQTLLTQPDSNISSTAMQHGFSHMGRFSSLYKNHFGELPSQTLKTAKNG